MSKNYRKINSSSSESEVSIGRNAQFSPLLNDIDDIPLVRLTKFQRRIVTINAVLTCTNCIMLLSFIILFTVKVVPFTKKIGGLDINEITSTIHKVTKFLNSSEYNKINNIVSNINVKNIDSYSHKLEKIIDWGCLKLPINCTDSLDY